MLGCNPGQPLLNWRPQDGSQEGIPTGIKVLGGVFGAGSGGSACDKNHSQQCSCNNSAVEGNFSYKVTTTDVFLSGSES